MGAGSVAPGIVYNCMGSSSWIALTTEKIVMDPQRRVMTWAHCVPGMLHASGTMQTAGSAVKWFVEKFGVKYDAADAVPAGANGLLFLPYLCGERTPWWNPDARGVFAGMSLSTTEEMYRAVLEGVANSLAYIREIFSERVDCGSTLRVVGGGARGATLVGILADACNCTVETIEGVAEATSTGAAVTGGVACGLFPGFDGKFCKMQPTVATDWKGTALLTFQRLLLTGSDVFYGEFVSKSSDGGLTWSETRNLTDGQSWHQSACNVWYANGNVYLVMERSVRSGDGRWFGWGVNRLEPVLMRAKEADDLTKRESWTFAESRCFDDFVDGGCGRRFEGFAIPWYRPFTDFGLKSWGDRKLLPPGAPMS